MLSPIIERRCKDKKNLANDIHCGLFFHIFYFSICVWTVPPVEVKVILGPS